MIPQHLCIMILIMSTAPRTVTEYMDQCLEAQHHVVLHLQGLCQADAHTANENVAMQLHRFVSRCYGMALPDSDQCLEAQHHVVHLSHGCRS